jgi:nucleoid-associated protein YgaU
MGSKGVALLVAVIGVIALAAAGIYLYRHHGAAPGVEDRVATGEKPAAEQAKPGEPQPAETAPSQPTSVPSFDVVRIEPSGEGVIAGRAQPGWTVTLESGGNKIADTKADEEGAWSIVLDKPLPAGENSLTLRATSPDGTQALTGQQPVQVAVGKPGGEVAQKEPGAPEPDKEAAPAAPGEQKTGEAAAPEQQTGEPQAVPGQPEPVVPDENAPPPVPPKAPVRIGKLDYQDTGADSGKISMAGVGRPNEHVFFFFDDQPLGDLVIGEDGTWTFEVEKKLGEGEHAIRADTYDAKTGVVEGRASLRLGREPKPEGAETASREAPPPQPEATPAPEAAPAEPATAEAGPSGQPEPVYPNGAPEEAASAEPQPPAVAGEPQDLSSQPQPVYPSEETAEAPPAEPAPPVAAAEPQDLSSQPQPVFPKEEAAPQTAPSQPEVAKEEPSPQPEPAQPEATPAEPSPPVVAAPPSEAKPPAPPKAPVVFKSVDYQDNGANSGKVALSGTGEPGARIFLYFDQTPLGEVSVGGDGTWTFEAEKKLESGEHKFRADTIEEGTGIVVGSASIGIMRMEKPKEEAAAAPPSPAAKPAPEAAAPQPESQAAATEEAKPEAAPEKQAQGKPHRPRVYTVRRGDTLWEIAEAYYGGGWHYRAIVRDNRRKIHNPHWIYPRQKFHMPAGR